MTRRGLVGRVRELERRLDKRDADLAGTRIELDSVIDRVLDLYDDVKFLREEMERMRSETRATDDTSGLPADLLGGPPDPSSEDGVEHGYVALLAHGAENLVNVGDLGLSEAQMIHAWKIEVVS